MCRQFSETSKSLRASQVVRILWRHFGMGEVGPSPVQVGPYKPVQSKGIRPGTTWMTLSSAALPARLKEIFPALCALISSTYRPSISTPLISNDPVFNPVAITRPAVGPLPTDRDPLASRRTRLQYTGSPVLRQLLSESMAASEPM